MSQLPLKHSIITQKFMWRKFMWGHVRSRGPTDSMNKGHIKTLSSDTLCRSSDFELLFKWLWVKSDGPNWGQRRSFGVVQAHSILKTGQLTINRTKIVTFGTSKRLFFRINASADQPDKIWDSECYNFLSGLLFTVLFFRMDCIWFTIIVSVANCVQAW